MLQAAPADSPPSRTWVLTAFLLVQPHVGFFGFYRVSGGSTVSEAGGHVDTWLGFSLNRRSLTGACSKLEYEKEKISSKKHRLSMQAAENAHRALGLCFHGNSSCRGSEMKMLLPRRSCVLILALRQKNSIHSKHHISVANYLLGLRTRRFLCGSAAPLRSFRSESSRCAAQRALLRPEETVRSAWPPAEARPLSTLEARLYAQHLP